MRKPATKAIANAIWVPKYAAIHMILTEIVPAMSGTQTAPTNSKRPKQAKKVAMKLRVAKIATLLVLLMGQDFITP
jgi:hypothetical protein